MAVAPHPPGPQLGVGGPDRGVGVDAEREVVVDEVLAGDAEVLSLEFLELFFSKFFISR